MYCSIVKCGELEYSVLYCSAVQCSVTQCTTMHCSISQCSAVQCSKVQCSAMQFRHDKLSGKYLATPRTPCTPHKNTSVWCTQSPNIYRYFQPLTKCPLCSECKNSAAFDSPCWQSSLLTKPWSYSKLKVPYTGNTEPSCMCVIQGYQKCTMGKRQHLEPKFKPCVHVCTTYLCL